MLHLRLLEDLAHVVDVTFCSCAMKATNSGDGPSFKESSLGHPTGNAGLGVCLFKPLVAAPARTVSAKFTGVAMEFSSPSLSATALTAARRAGISAEHCQALAASLSADRHLADGRTGRVHVHEPAHAAGRCAGAHFRRRSGPGRLAGFGERMIATIRHKGRSVRVQTRCNDAGTWLWAYRVGAGALRHGPALAVPSHGDAWTDAAAAAVEEIDAEEEQGQPARSAA